MKLLGLDARRLRFTYWSMRSSFFERVSNFNYLSTYSVNIKNYCYHVPKIAMPIFKTLVSGFTPDTNIYRSAAGANFFSLTAPKSKSHYATKDAVLFIAAYPTIPICCATMQK